jgi:peptidoglycan-associated lipoprotein
MTRCLLLASMLAFGACKTAEQVSSPSLPPLDESGNGALTQGVDGSNGALGADQAALAELQRAGTVVYFDYDRIEIRPEYVPLIAAHAKYLNGRTNVSVRLEGHTDERGSREYNIGLGERRAQAVRRALMLQGVADPQVTTVSYGEERPAAGGSDEGTYAKNRRVELVYPR